MTTTASPAAAPAAPAAADGGAAPAAAPAAPAAGAPAAAAPAPPASPAAPPPATAQLTPEQLKQRLDERAESERKKLLSALGVEKVDDLAAQLKELKALKDAQLSEQERTQKQLAELTKLSELGKLHETTAAAATAQLFNALPPAAQAAITELAPKTPGELLAHVNAYGKLAAAAALAAPPSPAAATAPAPLPPAPHTTTPPVSAPKPGGKTAFEVYSDMQARNDLSAGMFYSMNQKAIEQSRPVATT